MIDFDTGSDLVEEKSGPDMTPMIDMVFLLLIFFLLTSLIIRPSLSVALPDAETADTYQPENLVVSVERDGSLSLFGESISMEALLPALRSRVEREEVESITIKADRRVEFDVIVDIMDISRKAGAGAISFVVERK